ncbi:MAG TPA: hypothetical protein DEQ04_07145 [Thermovirga lienii]|nr:hypothetical protein [Thermovirga lienii]
MFLPFLIGVSGWKDSGKTTLCKKLVELLLARGWKVGFIKHTEKEVCPTSRSDSQILSDALGESVLWGKDGVVHVQKDKEVSLGKIVSRLYPGYDIVLLEGGKAMSLPKIWVKSSRPPEDVPGIVACYGEGLYEGAAPSFSFGQEEELAEFIEGILRKNVQRLEIYAESRKIPLKKFVGDFIEGAIRGMLSSLKQKPEDRENINIFIKAKK